MNMSFFFIQIICWDFGFLGILEPHPIFCQTIFEYYHIEKIY